MNKQKGYSVLGLMLAIFYAAIVIGWVLNIAWIFQSVGDKLTGLFVLRCVGVLVVPLGGALGWMW